MIFDTNLKMISQIFSKFMVKIEYIFSLICEIRIKNL